MMEAQGMKPFDEMTVPEAGEAGIGFIAQGEPEEVADVHDREIPGPQARPHPAVVYFHGGGTVIGDIEVADKPCRTPANVAKAAVVSVGYRKASVHSYPAAPEDCYAATRWVADNASDLGVDASGIAVACDSAGGNLAAVVAQMAAERGGPALTRRERRGLPADQRRDGLVLRHYLAGPGQIAEPLASPIRGSLAGLPPETVITAGYDPLSDEGAVCARALSDAGVAVRSDEKPTLIHGFIWMLGVIDETRAACGPRSGPELLPGLAVDRLADQVGVAVVPGVLLDHVDEDPAQAGRPAVGPCLLSRLVQPAAGQRVRDQRVGTGDSGLPHRAELVGGPAGGQVPVQVGVGVPVGGVPRGLPVQAVQVVGEPVVLHEGHVREQPAQRHRRGGDRHVQPVLVQAAALPGQSRAVVVEEAEEGGRLVGVVGRLRAPVLVDDAHGRRRYR